MDTFDLAALEAALPPGTSIAQFGAQIIIGNSFTVNNDSRPFAQTVKVTEADGVTQVDVQNWEAGVTSPEQSVARAYFFAALQAQLGEAYGAAAAAGTLPAWSPGTALPE